jgi:hypothetical protein
MAFTTCKRCGCKTIIAGMCVCITYATIHSDPLCFGARPDGAVALYCPKFVAEPVHGEHHDQPSTTWVRTGRAITVSSSTSATVTFYWQGGRPFPGGQR